MLSGNILILNEDMPGHLARRFQQIAVASFNSQVEPIDCDLTPVQYAALVAVQDQPQTDQATLASLIAHDRSTITGVVDRLVKKGLLTRAVNEHDRRARELRITEDGAILLKKVRPAVMRAQRMMIEGLEGEEKSDFIRLLKKAIKTAT